jgi:hypothetical protein
MIAVNATHSRSATVYDSRLTAFYAHRVEAGGTSKRKPSPLSRSAMVRLRICTPANLAPHAKAARLIRESQRREKAARWAAGNEAAIVSVRFLRGLERRAYSAFTPKWLTMPGTGRAETQRATEYGSSPIYPTTPAAPEHCRAFLPFLRRRFEAD